MTSNYAGYDPAVHDTYEIISTGDKTVIRMYVFNPETEEFVLQDITFNSTDITGPGKQTNKNPDPKDKFWDLDDLNDNLKFDFQKENIDQVVFFGTGNDNLKIKEQVGGDQGKYQIYHGEEGNDTLDGNAASSFTNGDDQPLHLFGGAGNDSLTGSSGGDYIFGGPGNDFIKGSKGKNFLAGDEGDDVIEGNDNKETIYGGDGSDFITAGDADDTVYGGDGDDIIYGEGGNDSIEGGAGNDIIDPGPRNTETVDTVWTGPGFDQVFTGNLQGATQYDPNAWTTWSEDVGDAGIQATVRLGYVAASQAKLLGGAAPALNIISSEAAPLISSWILGAASTGQQVIFPKDDFLTVADFNPAEDILIANTTVESSNTILTIEVDSNTALELSSDTQGIISLLNFDDDLAQQISSITGMTSQVVKEQLTARTAAYGVRVSYDEATDTKTATNIDFSTYDGDTDFIEEVLDGVEMTDGQSILLLGGIGPQFVIGEEWGTTANNQKLLSGGANIDFLSHQPTAELTHAQLLGVDGYFLGFGNDDFIDPTGSIAFNAMYGGDGNDTVSYVGALWSDTVNSVTGKIQDELAVRGLNIDLSITGVDQFIRKIGASDYGDDKALFDSIENVLGSEYADRIVGDDADNSLNGVHMDDTILGGAGNDTLTGGDDDTSNVDMSDTFATEMIEDDDQLFGEAGDDVLLGGRGDDTLVGGTGADTLDGQSGTGDVADYSASSSGVTIGLDGSAGSRGDAEGDTIQNVEILIGSAFSDKLTGDASDNTFITGAGSDVVDGSGGFNTLDYSASELPIQIDIVKKGGSGGDAEGDSFSSIHRIIGTAGDDTVLVSNRQRDDYTLSGTASEFVITRKSNGEAFTMVGFEAIEFADGKVSLTDDRALNGPVALAQNVFLPAGSTVDAAVSATDGLGTASNAFTYTLLEGPANGDVTLATDGSYMLAVDAGFAGSDEFAFEVSNGTWTDTGTVAITAVDPQASTIEFEPVLDGAVSAGGDAGWAGGDSVFLAAIDGGGAVIAREQGNLTIRFVGFTSTGADAGYGKADVGPIAPGDSYYLTKGPERGFYGSIQTSTLESSGASGLVAYYDSRADWAGLPGGSLPGDQLLPSATLTSSGQELAGFVQTTTGVEYYFSILESEDDFTPLTATALSTGSTEGINAVLPVGLADGGFAALGIGDFVDGSGERNGIFLQYVNSAGDQLVTVEEAASTNGTVFAAEAVTATADGLFAAWSVDGVSYGRFYGADGAPTSAAFQIASEGDVADAAVQANGSVLVIMETGELFVFAADGSPISHDLSLEAETIVAAEVEVLTNNNVAIAYSDGSTKYLELFGTGFNLAGSAGSDVLLGSDFADSVDAGDGNDTIEGGAGADGIIAGNGEDLITWAFGDGADGINGGNDTDRLIIDLDDGIAGSQTTASFELNSSDELEVVVGDDTFTVVNVEDLTILADPDGSDVSGRGALARAGVSTDTITFIGGDGDDTFDGSGILDVRVVLEGKAGDDVLIGGLLDDVISGGIGVDQMVGHEGDDTFVATLAELAEISQTGLLPPAPQITELVGGASNAGLIVGEVRDWLEGGDGNDKITLPENLEFGGVLPTSGGFQISGVDGAPVLLRSIEQLSFVVDGAELTASVQSTEQLITLELIYTIALGRNSDIEGLSFWNTKASNGQTLSDIATEFAETAEAGLSDLSDTAFIEEVYDRALGRASDTEGFEYWSGLLADDSVGRGDVILAFAVSDEAQDTHANAIDDGLFIFDV